ncbi:hypothetical protein KW787_03750 [Candidatus Pacearchaeota archaeon]|nr:hypothetical protein [Candidatus Pacearchaeota archaeon]
MTDEIRAVYKENSDGSRGGLMRIEGQDIDPRDRRDLDGLLPPQYLKGGKYKYEERNITDQPGERIRIYKHAAD